MNKNYAEVAIDGLEILTPREMSQADAYTIDSGVPGRSLMEEAGRAVAEVAQKHVKNGGSILIVAGPGNNGGDGYVAARILASKGYSCRVAQLGSSDALTGDAALAAADWSGETEPLSSETSLDADLIVDALFGAGLARDLDGLAAQTVVRISERGTPVVCVDLPSGIDGATGQVRGVAFKACATVTFFRAKPGHYLVPGRAHTGSLHIRQIGIGPVSLDTLAVRLWRNAPGLWADKFPVPAISAHKYDRGHTIVVSGSMSRTGAARLAASGALRIGSGLVTVAAPPAALMVHANHLTAIMLARVFDARDLGELLSDARHNAVIVGPAAGIGDATRAKVAACAASDAALVLDADALTSYAEHADELFELMSDLNRSHTAKPVVFTPHSGEFARLFPDLCADPDLSDDKVGLARAAASKSRCLIVLKGPDTVIAAPDGRAAINHNAAPWLATAGSGDVLAGLIGGLLAQHMPGFEAACAGVWIHGQIGTEFGPGLIAEDMPGAVPGVLRQLPNVFGH